jgi:hypothetical protein
MRLTQGGSQFAGRPGVADSRSLAHSHEHLADVGRVEGGAAVACEDQPSVLPLVSGLCLLAGLAVAHAPERVPRWLRQAEGAAGRLKVKGKPRSGGELLNPALCYRSPAR